MLDATVLAEDRHFWFRGLRRFAATLLDPHLSGRTDARILDCGTGSGRNLDWLRRYGRVAGVELSPVGLAAARAARRPVVRATVTALPFADASADLVTSFDVLYCLDDESEGRALAEMFRVLRPGGLALVNAAALDLLHGSHSILTGERRRYTRARLSARLTGAGFVVERLSFTNLTAFAPALVIRSLERLTGRAKQASEQDLRVPAAPINALLNAALTVEAQLLRYVSLPIGTSLMAIARKPGGS